MLLSPGLALAATCGVTWTPQKSNLANGYLVGFAWSGSQFVAVGQDYSTVAGVIRTSPDGINWTPRNSNLANGWVNGIAWSGRQFVAVGYDGSAGTPAIRTSSDGIAWTPQNSHLGGYLVNIDWSGGQFVAVGYNTFHFGGVADISPDGIFWQPYYSGPYYGRLDDIAWSGRQFVAGGHDNSTGAAVILTSACGWGDDFALADQRWTMIGLPAAPTTPTVAGVFGDLTGTYDTDWIVWWRDATTDQYVKLPSADATMAQGVGYWLKSYHGPATVSLIAAAATPLVTTNPNCPSTVGCYEITLATPAANRYNLVGFPLPYPVGWWDIEVEVNGASYTPSAAESAGYLAKTYWIWNGNGYDVYDDLTPAMIGMLQPWQGLWVKVLSNGVGRTIKLLVPAVPKVSQAPAPHAPAMERAERVVTAPTAWQRLMDWLIPTAAAAPPDRAPAIGERERENLRDRNGRALQEGREWYVRLSVEEPTLGLRDRNNVLGQLEDAAVGYDRYDLPELAPAYQPYLTVVFPHPDWGAKAGDYASDYRPTNRGLPAASWRFEIRSDVARTVRLRWEGPAAILSPGLRPGLDGGE